MDKLGVLLVSYGAREVAMADTLLRSKKYNVQLYMRISNATPTTPNTPQNTRLYQASTLTKSANSQKQTKQTSILS
jgi:phosphoribosylamine-glycine ligase